MLIRSAQMSTVRYELRGPAAWLTIDRPERRNALSNAVLAELRDGIRKAREDEAVRVVVVTGAGTEAFCAGGDLQEMDSDADAYEAHAGRSQLAGLFRDMWGMGKPTIARVDGFALAGGFGVALACDFVIASTNAQFGVPEVKVGLWPYMITVPLIRAMPPKTALQLMLTGRRVDAEEGMRLGFVTQLVAPEELDDATARLVDELADVSPQATALGRTAFYNVVDHEPELRLRMLEQALTVNLEMPDAKEGLAAFGEKRRPRWRRERE
jgi:enoyl-CoA hydratase